MTLHDAALIRFGQWWRRAERSGHAYAELAARHPGRYRRHVRGALLWGAAVPIAAILLLGGAVATRSGWLALAGLAVAALPFAQVARIARRERHERPAREALVWATFLVLDKPPHALGIARYWLSRLRGRRTALIEYKGQAVGERAA